MKILTNEEIMQNSKRQKIILLNSFDKEIKREIKELYDWETMTPNLILKTAKYLKSRI